MAYEIEAKLKVDDLTAIRNRLEAKGAAFESDATERNWVLDDQKGSLRKNNLLLRLRCLGDPGGIITVKRPAPGGEFKTREEIETMVDSIQDALTQFQALGYHVEWIYEKRRQTWLWQECVLALDECPEMGCFVEIEGQPDRIRQVASDLGLDPDNHIDDNYLGLWTKYLQDRGESRRDMVFK